MTLVRYSRSTVTALRRPVLAICGGGNAGHALAVVASQRFNGDILWLTSCEEKAEILRRGVFSESGLQSTGVIQGRADKVRLISCDPEQVIPRANLVMLAVPAFAHAPVLRQIAPFLRHDACVGSLPSRSGFEFEATQLLGEPKGSRVLFGLQTLPWSTRVQEPGKTVNFGALKAKVLLATLPAEHAPRLAPRLSKILGIELVPSANFLNMTLGNPGQIIHPGLMYGFFARWHGEHYRQNTIPFFYADASDETGKFVERLSNDVLRVARAIQRSSAGTVDLSGVLSIHDWLKISYPEQTKDASTVATCFRTGPLQHRKAPMLEIDADCFVPNFAYRYLSEDVPYGLAVTKAFAQIARVRTPALDAVLKWAQERLGKHYLVDGALDGPDAQDLPIPQNAHIDTLRDLVQWYAPARVTVPRAVSARMALAPSV
jgi:hypothetical protein